MSSFCFRQSLAASAALLLLLSGCIETTTTEPIVVGAPAPVRVDSSQVAVVDLASLDPANPVEVATSTAPAFGQPDVPRRGGYRNVNDPCQWAGSSRYTQRFAQEGSDLVACVRGGGAERTLAVVPGSRPVAQTSEFTLFLVPTGAVTTVPPIEVVTG